MQRIPYTSDDHGGRHAAARMTPEKLSRWAGGALAVGGVGTALHYVTHPPGETAQYTRYALWGLSHWLGGLAALLILFGLVAVYLRESDLVGALGLIGLVLAVIGTTLYAGGQILFGAALQPFIATHTPDWLEPNSPLLAAPAYRLTLAVTYLPLFLGYLLLAIVTLRAGVLPRLGSWLIILLVPIGLSALALSGSSLQGILQIITGVVWGAGVIVWGYALWSEKGEKIAGRPSD